MDFTVYHHESPVTGHWFLYADSELEARVGSMMLRPDGTIVSISVNHLLRRQGVASKMFFYALNHPDIPEPKHSHIRTPNGDAWAKAVGGYLPENKMPTIIASAGMVKV